jgi:hypothetical protein
MARLKSSVVKIRGVGPCGSSDNIATLLLVDNPKQVSNTKYGDIGLDASRSQIGLQLAMRSIRGLPPIVCSMAYTCHFVQCLAKHQKGNEHTSPQANFNSFRVLPQSFPFL